MPFRGRFNCLPSASASGAINVDTLPQMLIQRVDVVTGEHAALWPAVENVFVDKGYPVAHYNEV